MNFDDLNVFPPNSNQYVFTSSFQCDPNVFCKFSMHVPRHSQQHHTLKSYDLRKLAKGTNSIILCWECKFLLESVQSFRIFLYAIRSDSLHNYIQIELWDAPPQICTRTKHNHNSTECTSTVSEVRTLSENGSYKLTDRYLTQDD